MAEEKKDEDWMQKKWRPAMGWMYMLICTLDMGVFPILWSILQTVQHQTITQWQPLTLQGAGLFHLAMGAVLGIAAFGRTQEKIAGAATNVAPPAPSFGSPSMPSSFGMPSTDPVMSAVPDPSPAFGAPTDTSTPVTRPKPRPTLS
jgi:hypothetical protein